MAWLLPVTVLVLIGLHWVDPLRRSDLMVFLRAAHDVTSGANPYTAIDDPLLWGGSAFVYPYLTAFLFVPLTWVPVPVADVAWFALSAVAVIAGCRVLRLRDPIGVTAVLVSATCIRSFQVGSINALLFLGLALMWRYRERTAALAASFTFVAGAKLFLLPMGLWIALTRHWRATVAAALSASAFLGLGLVLAPIPARDFLTSMSVLAEHEGPQSMSVLRWATDLMPYEAARFVPVALGGAVILAAAWWSRRRPEIRSQILFAAAVIGSLLATPIYWSHYTILVAVPVLLASPTRRAAVGFCVASWFVSRPVLAWTNAQPSLGWQQVTLYGVMGVALLQLAGARRVREERVLAATTP